MKRTFTRLNFILFFFILISSLTTAQVTQDFRAINWQPGHKIAVQDTATAVVNGRVYKDINGNGTQDSFEPGMESIDMILIDAAGSQAVTTNANGDWLAYVIPGPVTIYVDITDLPFGAIHTEGDNPNTPSNNGGDPNTIVAVDDQTNFGGKDGFYFVGEVSGHLYFDLNGNGVQDFSEPDMPNVDVKVSDPFNNPPVIATTDASGNWVATVTAAQATVDIDDNDPDFPTGATQTEGTDPSTANVIANVNTFTENDGFYPEGYLTGHLYFDWNGNGTQDSAEPDMPDVDVTITDVFGNTQVVTTNASGNWQALVPEGETIANIDETDPDFPTGAVQTEGTNPTTTTVINNQTVFSENDGFFEEGTLTGHLYFDVNGNGTQDSTEPDMPNIEVEINNTPTGVIASVFTDANGNWSYTGPVGETMVTINENDTDFPTGAIQTEGTNPSTHTVIINESNFTENDGFYEQGRLSGHLYFDSNGNGMQDSSEPDMPNVDVNITDALNNTYTLVTDVNGDWVTNLPIGDAVINVDETDPDFPIGATQTEGTNPTTTTVINNQMVFSENDGFFEEGTLTGHLYFDVNGNGTQDGTEPDMPNVEVEITNQNLALSTVLSTDANGDWSYTGPIGATVVNINENDSNFPTGAIQTEGTNPSTHNVIINQNTFTENDGFFEQGTLTGRVYYDVNGNGNQDNNEPGIPNIDVNITDALSTVSTVVTDANGNWSADLPIGDVTISIDENDADFPTGAIQTEGANPSYATVLNNESVFTEKDGFSGEGELTGHVYYDTNGNANQELGEPDMANISVLVEIVNGTTQTLITDADGNWSFTAPIGPVSVLVDENDIDFPAGAIQTEGTNPTVFMVTNESENHQNDGFYVDQLQTGNLSGHLYYDTNANGVQDLSEPNLPNIDVSITSSVGVTFNVVTNNQGNWMVEVPEGNTTSSIDFTDPDFPNALVQTQGTNPTTTNVLPNVANIETPDGFTLPNTGTGTLSGHLYFDTNANSNQDQGEPNLINVDVAITNVLGLTTTVTTNQNGDWSISVPEGNTTSDIDNTDPEFPLGAIQTEGTDPTTTYVGAGENLSEINDGFEVQDIETEMLSGHLYYDTNANGVQDENEPNLPNVDVAITNSLGYIEIITTNSNGDWSITVPVGNTVSDIDFTDPDFPLAVSQTQGTNPTTTVVTAGNPATEEPDGFAQTAVGTNTLSGHLYYDWNANAVQDQGEPNLPNIEIEVVNAAGVSSFLQTDQNGDWSLLVPAGNTISEINENDPDFPVGAIQTEGTNPTTTAVTATGNFQEIDGYYNPNLATNILKGHLYLDENANAMQENTEPDLTNITVWITTSLGTTITLETDQDGNWEVEVPVGNTISEVDVNDADFPPNAIQTEGDNPTISNVTENTTSTEIDGFYIDGQSPELLSGHIYYDTNNNGVQDTGEPDLADIEVEIIDSFGFSQFVETDVDGNWEVNVPVGETVSFINQNDADFPEGAIQTEGDDPTTTIVVADGIHEEIDGFYVPETDPNVFEIYNALSPNGDGKNDFFLIEGIEDYPENKVLVFNRWGVKVFETKAYGQNGRVFRGLSDGRATLQKGEKLPAGTYFYILEYRNHEGKLNKLDGYLYIN